MIANTISSKYYVFIIGCVLLLASSGSAFTQKWLRGKWEGVGDQIDGKHWQVKLDASDISIIKIDYPDLYCGGNWDLDQKAGKTAKGIENIKYGLENCDQNAEIVIERQSKKEVKIVYFLRAYSPDPIATAILSKENRNKSAEK